MAFYPVEGDLVTGVELVEFHPEILVEHRIAVRFFPAAAFPRLEPSFGEAVLQVLAIGVDRDLGRGLGERHGGDGCR